MAADDFLGTMWPRGCSASGASSSVYFNLHPTGAASVTGFRPVCATTSTASNAPTTASPTPATVPTAPPAGVPTPSYTEVNAVQFGNGVTFSCPVAGCSLGAQGWSGSEFIPGATPSCSKMFPVGPQPFPLALLLRGPAHCCAVGAAAPDRMRRLGRHHVSAEPRLARLRALPNFTVRLDRPCSNPSRREPQAVLASFARCTRHLTRLPLGFAAQSVSHHYSSHRSPCKARSRTPSRA